ncbi:hypothetical protein [Salipiger mucosus]|uniref:hypothetical protein n=1 Tax=Salipiger mucosus TaxID=263378 RepID=UPI0012EC6138|nr:hypothetical protein [Salipiger mucosus]
MTDKDAKTDFDQKCMAALVDYVERYGLTPLAREALIRPSIDPNIILRLRPSAGSEPTG